MQKPTKTLASAFLAILVTFALLPSTSASAPLQRGGVHSPESPPPSVPSTRTRDRHVVRLLSSDEHGITFTVEVPWAELSVESILASDGSYVHVTLPGWSSTQKPGAPQLPTVSLSLGVPFGARLSIRVEPREEHRVRLPAEPLPAASARADALPVPGEDGVLPLPQIISSTEPDNAIYRGRAPYPASLAEVVSDGVLRQQRVVGVGLYPVQYHPASREVLIYESLLVTVLFDGREANTAHAARVESLAYEAVLKGQLLNYEEAKAWRQAGEAADTDAAPWAPPVPGWRVKTRAEGIYKLGYAELAQAGLGVDELDPQTFQMYHLGEEVAVEVVGESDGVFDPEDYLLFYGQAIHSKYTRDNVYWVTYGHEPGLRMAVRDGTPGAGLEPDHFGASLHLEQNSIYLPGTPGDEDLERWMWDYVYPPSRPSWTYGFSLVAPYAGNLTATLRMAMLGRLDNTINPDHHTQLYLNGTLLDDSWWDGMVWRISEVTFPQSLLLAGTNTLSLVCPNDTGVGVDLVYVDWAELEFADTFLAAADSAAFGYSAQGVWQYRIEGFSTESVAAYDVTNPWAVTHITGVQVTPSGSGYAALFQDDVSGPTEYRVAASSAYGAVHAIEQDSPSDLQSAINKADYLLVTHSAFAPAAGALRDWRNSGGLDAMLIDVQDVYDEFGYGIADAPAIRAFVAHAYQTWQAPSPSFLVLVGDGHYDPNDYKGYGRSSFMPPYLSPVDPWLGETAADNRYVAVAGSDTLPDLMMGRLSVNSADEATTLVSKIVAYEQSPEPGDWNSQVLAVADNGDAGGDFAQMSDAVLACCVPEPYQVEKVYYGITHTTPTDARAAIQAAINSGKLLVNFIGHASITGWASEGLLKVGDVPLLQNGARLPIMLPMTCYEGYFHSPFLQSANQDALAEVITRADDRGAVASWSPTGLGVASGHDYLDRGFLTATLVSGTRVLGQATMAGKINLWATGANLDLLDTYLLFGDPAMEINALETGADLQVTKSVEPSGPVLPGDVLVYTLTFANNGPSTAQGIVLSDAIPPQLANAQVIYQSPEVIGVIPGTLFDWQIADLPAGASGMIQVRAKVAGQTPPGDIVNTASIAGSGPDPSPDNNTASVSTTVLPVMRVASIVLKYAQPAPGRYTLTGQVRISDLARIPVDGATVQVQWTFPNGSTTNQQGVTDLLGRVNFRVKSLQSGTHKLCVTHLIKTGVVYMPARNLETCDTLVIP